LLLRWGSVLTSPASSAECSVRATASASPPPSAGGFAPGLDAAPPLSQEGQTYRATRDALRHERALQRLAEGRLGVADIAAGLAFDEPSAFHRAFRKWTGATPAAHRRKNRDGEARAESPTFTEDSGMRETLRKGRTVL